MNTVNPNHIDTLQTGLEQIMLRGDTWRGELPATVSVSGVDTGFSILNQALATKGWPSKGLIEVCQLGFSHQEWHLFTPTLRDTEGLIVLVNPPMLPFAHALINAGIDIDRLRIVRSSRAEDFVSSIVELCRTPVCAALLAWQQDLRLTYTDLRKCLLAANEGTGLYTVFRPATAQQQSSPASLRLLVGIQADAIAVTIFKQRGMLQGDTLIKLPLSSNVEPLLPFHMLDLSDLDDSAALRTKSRAPVVSIRGRK